LVNSALKQLSGTISILKAGSHNGEVDRRVRRQFLATAKPD
jgi:hypothetical protein